MFPSKCLQEPHALLINFSLLNITYLDNYYLTVSHRNSFQYLRPALIKISQFLSQLALNSISLNPDLN